MKIRQGFRSGKGQGGAGPSVNPISVTIFPLLGPLTSAQTPAEARTPGIYASAAGAIASVVPVYHVNGVSQPGTYDLQGGETVSFTDFVRDTAGNVRPVASGSVVVSFTTAPTFTAGRTTLSTQENATVPFVVDTYTVDQDAVFTLEGAAADVAKYDLIAVPNQPRSRQLRRIAPLNYEADATDQVTIRATNASELSTSLTFTHTITNDTRDDPVAVQIITANRMPVMGALTDLQTPAAAFTAGEYTSSAEAAPPPPAASGFVPPDLDGITISTLSGGRPAPIRQIYFDTVDAEAHDPVNHPSFPTYTHTAIASGNFSNPAIWNTGSVPGENAVVNVGSFDVTYDVFSNNKLWGIHVGGAGTLRWSKAVDTRMWVYTLMIHGTTIMGDHLGPIPESNTRGRAKAEVIWWFPERPGVTVKGGLVTMGPVRIFGAAKADTLRPTANILAGATSATFSPAALTLSGWREGDEVVFASTSQPGKVSSDPTYRGPTSIWSMWMNDHEDRSVSDWAAYGYRRSQEENRIIETINFTTGVITWAGGLTYAHSFLTGELPDGTPVSMAPRVCNLSRSILFRSADASDRAIWPGSDLTDLQKRGHIMFMHSDDVWVGYARHRNGGRTDTDPTLVPGPGVHTPGPDISPGDEVVYLADRVTNAASPDNVRGRYSWHLHNRFADSFAFKLSTWLGLVSDGQPGPDLSAVPNPGWGFTQHGGRLAMHNCVAYNHRGAGFVWEFGTELGQCYHCTSMWNRGDGYGVAYGDRTEVSANHNGHQGVGFEMQARQILMGQNHVTSSHLAYCYFQQEVDTHLRAPDHLAIRYADPINWGSGRRDGQNLPGYGPEHAQIPVFDDCTAVGIRDWLFVAHRQFTDRTDGTPGIFRRCHAFHFDNAALHILNYSFRYGVYDSLWRYGTECAGNIGAVSWAFMFVNVRVQDVPKGFRNSGLGMNYEGHWIAAGGEAGMFVNVAQPFDVGPYAISDPGDNPNNHPSADLMGDWVVTDPNNPSPGYTVYIRRWRVQLPGEFPMAPAANYPKTIRTDPAPGQPRPRFTETITAESSKVVTPTDGNITIRGVLADGLGLRRFGDWYSSESFGASTAPQSDPKRNEPYATGTMLVERNGCFNDGGGWKVPFWFIDYDRLTGSRFSFLVTRPLSGFDPAFLAANTVDPNAVRPVLPLPREAVSATPPAIGAATPPPTDSGTGGGTTPPAATGGAPTEVVASRTIVPFNTAVATERTITHPAATAGNRRVLYLSPDKVALVTLQQAGWDVHEAHDAGTGVCFILASKWAVGGETSVSFTTNNAVTATAIYSEWAGVNPTTPVSTGAKSVVNASTAARTTGEIQAYASDRANQVAIAFASNDSQANVRAGTSGGWSEGFTELAGHQRPGTGVASGSGEPFVSMATKVFPTEGTARFTAYSYLDGTADEMVGAMLVLNPA